MVEFQQSQKFIHKLSHLERRESYLYFLPSFIFFLFLSTFVLEIISDLHRSCKDKQERPHVSFTQLLPMLFYIIMVQFSSVQSLSRVWLCDPMNCSAPGLPVHHQLPEFTQTHVHRVSDAIQPSHPLSSPSPPAPNPSQHQSLFQWVRSSHEVAKVLEFQL